MTGQIAPTPQAGLCVAKLGDAVVAAPAHATVAGAHWDDVAGERIAFLPQRAAWWARARTLILADLHLGKAEAFAAAGAGLNGGVLDETLARIGHLVETLGAARLIVAGDLLHAPAGLTGAMMARVREWRRSLGAEIVVVPGNHDRRIDVAAREWDIVVTAPSFIEHPFGFVHDPVDVPTTSDVRAWWVGHVHPCVRLGGRGDALKLPCFIVSGDAASGQVVRLPAFSVFTSGVCVRPNPGDRVHAVADATVVPLTR